MKTFFLALLLSFTLSCSSCVLSRTVRDIYRESSPAVLKLQFPEGRCSSFHVGNGLVLTAAHCITEGGNEIGRQIYSESGLVAENPDVVYENPDIDVAILEAPELKDTPYLLFGNEPEIGERIVAIGYPGYGQNTQVPEIGYVLGIEHKDNESIVYGNGNAFPGLSGGPVIDEHGFVIGMVSAIRLDGAYLPNGMHIHRDISIFIGSETLKIKVQEAISGDKTY